jgi:RNA polymerase sigma-70 factor, ECF subfamily
LRPDTDASHEASGEVTDLLLQWSGGDQDALQRLMPLVYDQFRKIAGRQLRLERDEHTLDPTALVHELYIRLVDQRRTSWQNRAQFFGVAAQLMRRILVDHARSRLAQKRGGSRVLVTLQENLVQAEQPGATEILALDRALARLSDLDPEQGRLVELRFFAGLTIEETAVVLGYSSRTVKREWQLARAWLFRELQRSATP